jgi:ubiquinone/menaquinone biosynthesis C-methylase UbiE
MNEQATISCRAQCSELLEERIKQNLASQQIDLIEWICNNVSIAKDGKILELCCGTGSQTLPLLSKVGEKGHVIALDISKESLLKLHSKIPDGWSDRLTLIESNMDDVHKALDRENLAKPYFDMVFSAYGLYYSKNPSMILNDVFQWLKPGGSVVIVGPYGPNNEQLFSFLRQSFVKIPDFVKYTSSDFMCSVVIPWLSSKFSDILIHTIVNKVAWKDKADVLAYWENTTFYDNDKFSAIDRQLNEYFVHNETFINEKWIMLIEALNARN